MVQVCSIGKQSTEANPVARISLLEEGVSAFLPR
jgi:hypothetical protein